MIIPIGALFIFLAFLFYTISVWSERIRGKLLTWMIISFVIGFVCDLTGTSFMIFRSVEKFSLDFHKIAGYSALLIMFLHLLWALLSKINNKYENYFTKFSIFAWFIWLLAFINGIPK